MKQHSIRDCLPIEEFPAYMNGWCRKKPGYVTVSSIGKSGGYDILKAVFTDPHVSDKDKPIVLLTAQHSVELSGVTSLLSVGNHLFSDAPDTCEILQKLIIVMIPCSNPYSYSKQDPSYQFKNEAGICEYFAFDYNRISFDAETAPAAHAIWQTLDFYKPDPMLDVHGVYYQNQMDGALQIEHGMTVRLALPFADARNFTVLYNGYEKQEDELDGYTVTKHANWVYIDLNIPADKISPFAIAMVKYDCTIPKVGIMEF